MDPPAYQPTQPVRRSITDLRAQIIANASVMRPRNNGTGRASDDHIELIVAKTSAVNPRQPLPGPSQVQKPVSGKEGEPDSTSRGSASLSLDRRTVHGGKHYALLTKRALDSTVVPIIIKGEPRDSVEEALEWMLERTEMMLHQHVVKHGRQAGESCAVM